MTTMKTERQIIKTMNNSLMIIVSLDIMENSLNIILLAKECHTRRSMIIDDTEDEYSEHDENFHCKENYVKNISMDHTEI